MTDKKNREYETITEGEMIRLNYRDTTGVYPAKIFNALPIEKILDLADYQIDKIFNKNRYRS